jgi:hypothetical protein
MWNDKVLFAVEAIAPAPETHRRAGFMNAAKMSGQAASYDTVHPGRRGTGLSADETGRIPSIPGVLCTTTTASRT